MFKIRNQNLEKKLPMNILNLILMAAFYFGVFWSSDPVQALKSDGKDFETISLVDLEKIYLKSPENYSKKEHSHLLDTKSVDDMLDSFFEFFVYFTTLDQTSKAFDWIGLTMTKFNFPEIVEFIEGWSSLFTFSNDLEKKEHELRTSFIITIGKNPPTLKDLIENSSSKEKYNKLIDDNSETLDLMKRQCQCSNITELEKIGIKPETPFILAHLSLLTTKNDEVNATPIITSIVGVILIILVIVAGFRYCKMKKAKKITNLTSSYFTSTDDKANYQVHN
jgi:hypothetical protein